MKNLIRILFSAFLALTASALQAGSLKVTISPSQAVSAGAQWRVDAGAWNASGTTLKNLTNTTHTVDFKAVTGWITPAPFSVTLSGNGTTSSTGTYVQTAALTVNLTPAAAQWRVDAGAWRNSGTAATGLAPGNHTVEFGTLAGYTTPVPATVTLTAGQSQTLNRTYAAQAGLSITLSPSAGQWRVNGGAWRASGTTAGFDAGIWTIDYAAVANYQTPPSESVTLTACQSLNLSRTYTILPTSLTVSLTPAAQWRVDAGAWRNSGTTATGLATGNHTVEYGADIGYTTPPSEVITLSAGQSLTLNRTYAAQARLAVTLYPGTAQWRVNGGAWRASGGNWTFLDAGTYNIEYAPLTDHQAPPSETVTLTAGQTLALTRLYTYTPATISMSITGDNGFGRWRVDDGQWWPTNVSLSVPSGTRAIEYLQVPGYTAPPTETVTLAERQFLSLNRSYVALPASLSVTLTPATARWRVNGGPWQSSGTVVSVNAGFRSVEYEHADYYISPEAETVNVFGDTVIARSYIAGAGDLLVHSNPPLLGARGAAQWRIDGGPWRSCGARTGVQPGAHTLEFKQATGLNTPAPSSITVGAGALLELEADFTMHHRLRFFIKDGLAAGLTTADLQARLSQYAAHLQTIWHRETARRFTFNPATDITICTVDPFSGYYVGSNLPELGFEVWVYARLTDNLAYGTYGGYAGIDATGAGGAAGLRWDRIYDPSVLQPDTPEMMQYWRQIDQMTHEFQHAFGAGFGEYYTLGTLADPTGVAPILPTVSFSDPAPGDPFWGTHQEYWADPLQIEIYGQARVGSPKSLPVLLDTVRFAPASKGVINGLCRRSTPADTLPDLNHVKVRVVDATTGLPIPGATCRAWNRRVDGTYNTFEQTVVATATPGEFEFAWTPYPAFSPLNNYDNAKIVKAWAPGYTPAAQWESVYDAQKARTWDLKDVFEITLALTPK